MQRPVGLGHLSIGVVELRRSARFYDAVLAAIGFVRKWSDEDAIGYGPPDGGDPIQIIEKAGAAPPGPGFHLAFNAPDRAAVEAFHAAGVANGGADNGAPGLRPHYSPTYYAAFVIDPDGWRLEAVHQE
jgi:catechol 2,3-dioxygenase-like lactoylglutathione lyase family enzyme